MPWVRIDDGFWCHPKVMAAGLAATGLYVRALSWSGQQLTDGKIPKHMLAALGGGARTKKAAARLVEVGLWAEGTDAYQIPDFLEFNKSRVEVTEKRNQAKGRMSRVRASRSPDVRANNERTGAEPDGKFAAGSPNPIPTHPDPSHPKDNNTPSGGAAELPLTMEAFRTAAPRSIGWPPSVFWESTLKALGKEHGDAYLAGHLGQFFAAGGRTPEALERRCAEDWGGQPAAAQGNGKPSAWTADTHCGGWRPTGEDSKPGGYPLIERCLSPIGGCGGDHSWSAPLVDGETPQPRETRA